MFVHFRKSWRWGTTGKDPWTAFATGSIKSLVGLVILAPTTFQAEETTFRPWTQPCWSPGLFPSRSFNEQKWTMFWILPRTSIEHLTWTNYPQCKVLVEVWILWLLAYHIFLCELHCLNGHYQDVTVYVAGDCTYWLNNWIELNFLYCRHTWRMTKLQQPPLLSATTFKTWQEHKGCLLFPVCFFSFYCWW